MNTIAIDISKFRQSAKLILMRFIDKGVQIIDLDPISNSYFVCINGNYLYLQGIITPLNTLSASTLANNKLSSKEILHFFNIPTPDYLCFKKKEEKNSDTIRKELEQFLKNYKRIIAKPQNGLKSKDVFLNIQNIDEAMEAYVNIMNKEYTGVLFENFIEGDVHRLLFINGVHVAALRREKGHIIADGINTIRQLIILKNQYLDHGGRKVGRIIIDAKLKNIIKDQGFNTLDIIPSKSTKIFTEIDFSNLETVTEVTNSVDPTLIKKLGEFANKVGLGLTGIDVISTDITDESKCSVIEINKEPAIDFHHYPDYGEPKDIAGKIVEVIIEKYS